MGALSKQGFIFTQAEKDLVKQLDETGRHAEAQNVILEAMEGSFMGAAEAINYASEAHNRLTTATEEWKRAQGESLNGWTVWWDTFWAKTKEGQTKELDLNNAAARAAKNIADGYAKQTEDLEKYRDKLEQVKREGSESFETILYYENLLKKAEIDLDMQKAEDELKRLEKAFQDVGESTNLAELGVDYLKKGIWALPDAFNYIKQGGSAGVKALQERIKAQQELVKQKEADAKKTTDALAANAIAIDHAKKDSENINKQREEGDAILARQAQTLREIDVALNKGLIDEEEANKQRASAYETAAKDLITLADETKAMKLVQVSLDGEQTAGQIEKNALQEEQNKLIDEAVAGMKKYTVESGK
jgi:hypothetical protein